MEVTKHRELYLNPGAIFVSQLPYKITTVLGSCVSVILWDEINKFGGINHYLQPFSNKIGGNIREYGDNSIEVLIKRMQHFGSNIENLNARIYGGTSTMSSFSVWSENIKIANKLLQKYNIPIVERDTGGDLSRIIIFDTLTGIVKLDLIEKK